MTNIYDIFETTTTVQSDNHRKALEYLQSRGITLDTASKYHLQYSVMETMYGDVVGITIPTSADSSITRNIDPPDSVPRFYKKGSNQFFNFTALVASTEPVIITEGEIDALSVLQTGKCAVSLGGVTNADSFLSELKKAGKRIPLILALDSDPAGQACIQKIQAEAKKLGIACLVPNLCGVKDINELLCKDATAFSKRIAKWVEDAKKLETVFTPEEERVWKQYFPHRMDEITASLDDSIRASITKPRIETGFKLLDEAIGGGVREGIYVLGGAPSIGKTTFCLQIASNIALQGHDVFLFSYEMTAAEIQTKNIVRTHCFTKNKYITLTTNEILRGIIFQNQGKEKAYYDARKKLDEVNRHLFFFAEEDMNIKVIKEKVEKYISLMHRSPVVLIDYLQMIPPTDNRHNDKQTIDNIMLTLRQLKNLGVACFVISSLSRASYDTPITLSSFKESGSIEFSADLALALDYEAMYATQPNTKGKIEIDLNQERRNPVRKVVLTLLKNRLGEAGKQIRFDFIPAGNLFCETGEFVK